MKRLLWSVVITLSLVLPVTVPAQENAIPIEKESVEPGTAVALKGEAVELYEGSLKEGDNFLELLEGTDIHFPFNNNVTIVSVVPSLDTKVCDVQTHTLGESGEIAEGVDVVTISRDLPMAQSRFANVNNLTDIRYVSDYKTGSFGKTTGFMMQGKELLARGLIVLDKEGVVRYLQVVPEVSHLPDVNKAIQVANDLAADK